MNIKIISVLFAVLFASKAITASQTQELSQEEWKEWNASPSLTKLSQYDPQDSLPTAKPRTLDPDLTLISITGQNLGYTNDTEEVADKEELSPEEWETAQTLLDLSQYNPQDSLPTAKPRALAHAPTLISITGQNPAHVNDTDEVNEPFVLPPQAPPSSAFEQPPINHVEYQAGKKNELHGLQQEFCECQQKFLHVLQNPKLANPSLISLLKAHTSWLKDEVTRKIRRPKGNAEYLSDLHSLLEKINHVHVSLQDDKYSQIPLNANESPLTAYDLLEEEKGLKRSANDLIENDNKPPAKRRLVTTF